MRYAARRSGLRAALAPHWGAILALALFLVAGLAVLDDYGVTWDERTQRRFAIATLAHLLGDADELPDVSDRFYGMAFEEPLLLVERAFGMQDTREIYLSRHLLTHLVFLTGGLFAYLLARRLLNHNALALIAMLFFLLHPRLYAHSFFNSKDVPFLVMFIIALYLAHRAFRRDRVSAFVLLGAGVGLLVNLRIMGVVLLAAIPAMRALDFAFAGGQTERRRIVLTSGAFTLAAWLTVYALLPSLWADPIGRIVEWWTVSSAHPNVEAELFGGRIYASLMLPADYIPVWFSITSPPFALLLGVIGAAGVIAGCVRTPIQALRNTRLRFGLLAAGCFTLPILAVILLDANVYHGWRQMYFLWAPFSLLGVFGLRWLVSTLGQARLRAAVYGAAGAGLAATLLSMAMIHPNQQAYFNFFVDRTTPEHLGAQYTMDYWLHPTRQAFEWLLDRNASSPVKVNPSDFGSIVGRNAGILPEAARERVFTAPDADALTLAYGPAADEDRAIYALKVYGSTIASLSRKADLRAAYAAAKTSEPILRSVFAVHHEGGALVYIKEPCSEAAIAGRFELWVVPEHESDLTGAWARLGYEDRSFGFPGHGAVFDGKCAASVPLPSYPVASVRLGQWLPGEGPGSPETPLWESNAVLDPDAWRAAHRAAVAGEPLARAVFDLYLNDDALVYVKESCGQADTETRFFLHLVPERVDDLPRERRGHGFDNLDFEFFLRGGHFDGKCLARVPLPGYAIASIRTGQFVGGEGELWREEFAPAGE